MASASSASLWAVAGGAGTRGVSFLVFLLIARQLSPADMGVMAIAMAFGLFMDAVNELGMPDQVVRFKGQDSDPFLSSVFWLQTGVAVAGALLLAVGAPRLAAWYAEPQLVQACWGVGTAAVLSAASLMPLSLLRKRMAFRAIAIRNTVATVLGGVVGLSMAYAGHGLAALVMMHVANAAAGLLVALYSCAWRPSWRYDAASIKAIRTMAWHTLGTRMVETVTSRVDQLLIGAFFGTTVLGFYALAVRFFDVIFQTICGPIAAVLFSYLADQHDSPAQLRARYLTALRNLALLAPTLFLMAVLLLPDLLGLLFGAKWAPLTPYLHIILGAGVVLGVTFSHTAVFSAIGQPSVNLWVSAVSSLLWLVSLGFLPALGAIYAAVLWVVRMALGIPVQIYALQRLTTISLSDYARAVVPGCVSVVLVLVLAWLMSPPAEAGAEQVVCSLLGLGLSSAMVMVVVAVRFSDALRGRLAKICFGLTAR